MTTNPYDYTAENLRVAAKQARGYADAARAVARIHATCAVNLTGTELTVANAFMQVALENAAHADQTALMYERAAASCR